MEGFRWFRYGHQNAGLSNVLAQFMLHTAGAKMAAAGIPMPKISQFTGHSNAVMTERAYARFAPDHMKDAAAGLELGLRRVVKQVRTTITHFGNIA